MQMRFRPYLGIPALLLFLGLAAAPARADITVAQYLNLEKEVQADLLGKMLQSLADNLQAKDRDKEAECLAALYTIQSEARVPRSQGMVDFQQSVELARKDDPEKVTLEEIIARQLVQYCGVRPSMKK